ncbi:Transposon TyH3 Gag polyprotein, partial [Bienertia sinuspersici]
SARALKLDSQFINTKIEQFDGVKPYCTRLKTLADSLKNVGDKVSDNRMALQLLKGLSDEYKSFRTTVRHLKPFPSFDELRSMIELEEQSNASDLLVKAQAEAHVAHASPPSSSPVTEPPKSGLSKGSTSRGGGGRKYRKGKGHSGKGKGSQKQSQPPRNSRQQQQPSFGAPTIRGLCHPIWLFGSNQGLAHRVPTQHRQQQRLLGVRGPCHNNPVFLGLVRI